jgi:mutator protein MutT
MKRVDIVALIVSKDDKILVEKRSLEKSADPGAIIVPSGHVEQGETLEDACKRELKEEVNLDCDEFEFIIKLPNKTGTEEQMIHFHSCVKWRGDPKKSREAEEIFWIDSNQIDIIDHEIDKVALKEFLNKRASE